VLGILSLALPFKEKERSWKRFSIDFVSCPYCTFDLFVSLLLCYYFPPHLICQGVRKA